MHTIHNIAFEVDVNHDNQLVSWEQYYVDFFQEKLLPRVERVCDDWDKKHPNTKCTIDTININVDVDNLDLETLQRNIIQQINQQLMSIQADGSSHDGKVIAKITHEASPFDALMSYVSDGILPASISVKVFKEWLSSITEFTSLEKSKLNSLFAENSDAIERMLSLLRNDYEKFLNITESRQQVTSQFVRLENAFFQEFFKAICKSLKLEYNNDQAEIWYKTLGYSSSLKQFSKTFIQLLTPKVQSEGKRLTNNNLKYISIALFQAIIQYEAGMSITIEASKITNIVKDTNAKPKATKTIDGETDTTVNSQNKAKDDEVVSKTKDTAKKHQTSKNGIGEQVDNLQNTNAKTSQTEDKKVSEKHKTLKDSLPNLAEANTKKTITEEIALTSEKAGLILLHPFLVRFLKGVELITEDNEINDIGKACMLLHYLATETEEVTDVELTLEKIMLGIPLKTIVDYQTPLTENDKKLCDELLNAVLEHWVVLKKSTVNTLRDMFLKRDGHIKITEDSIKLKIERAAQDILLEKVPWNISLFRLKWMEKTMHIEW